MNHALGDAVQPLKLRNVASNVFTAPEIATVGFTQQNYRENPTDIDTVMLPLDTNPRAKMLGIEDGFVKIFARRGSASSSAESSSARGPANSSCRSRWQWRTDSPSTSSR